MLRSGCSKRPAGAPPRPRSSRWSRAGFRRRSSTSTCARARSRRLPPPAQLGALSRDHQKVWIKRGDVHAERPEDVVATTLDALPEALRAFTGRGIPWVALQEPVPGPVVKFYGVTDGRFFNWYGADAAFPEPDRPVLIDINDWPSFAPFREPAARAIAAYITHRFAHRKHS